MTAPSTEHNAATGNLTDELFVTLYADLKRLASSRLAGEANQRTLTPTALVHEVYLRLLGNRGNVAWDNDRHFFSAAAEAMRRVLVDRARAKNTRRRGGDLDQVPLTKDSWSYAIAPDRVLILHEALVEFEQTNPDAADLIKLRYFTGLSIEQAAELLHLSRATAYRLWTFAKAWLYDRIHDQEHDPSTDSAAVHRDAGGPPDAPGR